MALGKLVDPWKIVWRPSFCPPLDSFHVFLPVRGEITLPGCLGLPIIQFTSYVTCLEICFNPLNPVWFHTHSMTSSQSPKQLAGCSLLKRSHACTHRNCVLTHWPLKDVAVILKLVIFRVIYLDMKETGLDPYREVSVKLSKGELCKTSLITWLVTIGSGNGLVQSGKKPLPEPTLTKLHITRPQWALGLAIKGFGDYTDLLWWK